MNANWSASDVLGESGLFSDALPGFKPRYEQQQLAMAVERALRLDQLLIGEAGTGVGKTFAYLVPALLSRKKIILSTGTRHLQDQLYLKDLPRVRKLLKSSAKIALLKGRANYLCKHRLVRAIGHPLLKQPQYKAQLEAIRRWSFLTETGDISEVAEVPEGSPVWSLVTSTPEFCGGHEFEELADCFVHQARKNAQEADIVVVNHHLLCADLAIKDGGFGEVLPSANGFVIDEAHQLPEIASSFFGIKFSNRQLHDLARDAIGEQMQDAPDMAEIREAAELLERASAEFRLALGVPSRREAWTHLREDQKIMAALGELLDAYNELCSLLDLASERGKGLDSCFRRCEQQIEVLESFEAEEQGEYIYWLETNRNSYSLNKTPLDVAEPFRKALNGLRASWVFTSATLSVGGQFNHFRARLGLGKCEEICLDSPFDYQQNALMYLPPSMPAPNSPYYLQTLLQQISPVLEASSGRAFLLFTSHRALREAAEWLRMNADYHLLVQGEAPKRELVDVFASTERALLLGTSTFWEGVDVRGEALSCVVIDKLPFASPGDPVLQARIDVLKQRGGSPFTEYQLPQAAIALKQGVGRLIRDVEDRGVLVLCDPRIYNKSYGRLFLKSLPDMRRTRDVADVQQFFAENPS